ncbi:MAG: hypothetical protein ACLQIB_53810 [Isosphaeraceae bacterium]
MRCNQKTALLLAFMLLGVGTRVFAQGRGYYGRVTTSSREVISEASSRGSAGRGSGYGYAAAATRSAFRADSLHAYSDMALERARDPEAGVPRSSTWRQEPLPPDETPPPTVRTRSRTYFPTMRPGVAFQQPVTLTATQFVGHICTCSRGGIIAGMGHHR